MDKDLKRKLQLIEDRISQINSRESRKIQYKINTYSMMLGAILALSVALIVESVKILIPSSLSTFIGLTIYVCLILGIFFWAKSKELMDIGDFEIEGNLNIKDDARSKFINTLENIISTQNKSLKKKIRPSLKGMNILGYWYNTLRCDFNDKVKYILTKSHLINNILINYTSNENSKISQIFLDFKSGKFIISLDERHFSYTDANCIISKLKKLNYDFFDQNKSKIRGF